MAKIIALIWDYDGTLVDTRYKNLSVNRRIVEEITNKSADSFPSLKSVVNYQIAQKRMTNWQDLYKNEYGMDDNVIVYASQLWSKYQAIDLTETPLYFGMHEILEKFSNYPQGIFSQNSTGQIANSLRNHKIDKYFASIIGFEEIGLDQQKPSPYGLVKTIKTLSDNLKGEVIFIGDHITDFKCAMNTREFFRENNIDINIRMIGVNYTPEKNKDAWTITPEFVADKINDIPEIVEKIEKEN